MPLPNFTSDYINIILNQIEGSEFFKFHINVSRNQGSFDFRFATMTDKGFILLRCLFGLCAHRFCTSRLLLIYWSHINKA